MPAGQATALESFVAALLASASESFTGSFVASLSVGVADFGAVSRFGAVSALCVASAGNASVACKRGSRSIGGADLEPAQPTIKTSKIPDNRIDREGSA